MGFSYRRSFLCHRTGAYGLHKTDPRTNTGEQIDKIGFLGIFTGGLTASAAGITAAMTFAFIFSLFFKSSAKE